MATKRKASKSRSRELKASLRLRRIRSERRCQALALLSVTVNSEPSVRNDSDVIPARIHCAACRKIARMRIQFPLQEDRAGDQRGPILPREPLSRLWDWPLETPAEEDERIRGLLGPVLFKVFHLAENGDRRALRLLVQTVDELVENLESIADRQPNCSRHLHGNRAVGQRSLGNEPKCLPSCTRNVCENDRLARMIFHASGMLGGASTVTAFFAMVAEKTCRSFKAAFLYRGRSGVEMV